MWSLRDTAPRAGAALAPMPVAPAVDSVNRCAWRAKTAKELEETPREHRDKPEVLLRYAPTRLLLSGWIESPATIQHQAAWVRATHGAGSLHLFGFRPQYRGWSQATFHLLFRALLLE